jgi:hypothetical protein
MSIESRYAPSAREQNASSTQAFQFHAYSKLRRRNYILAIGDEYLFM